MKRWSAGRIAIGLGIAFVVAAVVGAVGAATVRWKTAPRARVAERTAPLAESAAALAEPATAVGASASLVDADLQPVA